MKYKPTSLEIEAIQWTGSNLSDIDNFVQNRFIICTEGNTLSIDRINDMIYIDTYILLIDGQYLVMLENDFEKAYELV